MALPLTCPNCNSIQSFGQQFCRSCGMPLAAQVQSIHSAPTKRISTQKIENVQLLKKSIIGRRYVALALGLLLIAAAVVIIALTRGVGDRKENSIAKQEVISSPVQPHEINPISTPTITPTATPTPTTTPTPVSQSTPLPIIKVIGVWKGKYVNNASTLIINNQNDNSFTGSISSGGVLIAIKGSINPTTREIILSEEQVLTLGPNYEEWALITSRGLLSNDGKTMNGSFEGDPPDKWTFKR